MAVAVSAEPIFEPLLWFGSIVTLVAVSVAAKDVADRIEGILQKLRLDEKLALLHGAKDPSQTAEVACVPGISRLDIPSLRYTDFEHGDMTESSYTRFPSTIAVGASFDSSLARRIGRVRAREGRARGQNVLLGPSANLLRVPRSDRSPQILGEDPLLVGDLIEQEVAGIQEEGMIATTRYFLAHTVEKGCDRLSVTVGERALREVYLPAFKRAVDAGVGSIVGAPHRVNGTFACDNEHLLTELLREDLGFEGWVMTAWYARHSLEALQAGLDQEMPGIATPDAPQAVYFDKPLRRAVETGRIPESDVDRSVRRILLQMQQVGLLDEEPSSYIVDSDVGARLAFDAAVSGAVLLRNEEDTLPIDPTDTRSLAVIGPFADRPPSFRSKGGARSPADDRQSPLDELRKRLDPHAAIEFEPGVDPDGVPVPGTVLSPSPSVNVDGMRRRTTEGTVTIDPIVDFTGRDALPPGSSWTWTGTITAPEAGRYELKVRTNGGWGQLVVDGCLVASTGEDWEKVGVSAGPARRNEACTMLDLQAGETSVVTIRVDGSDYAGWQSTDKPLEVQLSWVTPSRRRRMLEQAVDVARRSEAAIIFGASYSPACADGTSLELSSLQDELIEEVARISPSTTVVLNTGGPVLMPWIDDVNAVLEMWYPGQEGGEATAALLTGDVAPGGRLPVTFPRRGDETPACSEERYPGENGRAHFSEGVFVGYRWYDENEVDPLFSFGHGLSYTTFTYYDQSVEVHGDEYTVRFRVENTSDRVGVAVPQVYVGRPESPPVPMPPKELLGVERVELDPGEEVELAVSFGRRALSYWSEADGEWRLAEGDRSVYVGSSSRRLHLETTIHVG